MKFLRLAFYVLIAQLVLSGCAGEGVEETSSSSSSEINFDAYVGRNASTRSEVIDNTFLQGGNFNAGFGVFARYKHTKEENSSLMLMDNEHVTWQENHWGYTNTRYWPNEGFVDFYAFAPHSTAPNLNNNFEIDFPSNMSPVDLVYAKAEGKTKADNPVKFTFKHALARLGFDITANQELLEDGTVITVKEVRLYGATETSGIFLMGGHLNLQTGGWRPYDNHIRWFYTWTPDGKVEGEEDGEEGKEEGNKDGNKDGEEVKKIIYKLSASQLDYKTPSITNADDSYIFIIPQKKPEYFNLKLTYTVKQGEFEEDVTVKKDLLKVFPSGDDSKPFIEGGKAYVFHLKLLDPINFDVSADVNPWGKDDQ